MATLTATALQDEPLDALVWRVLGTASPTVEAVLELNRDLAPIASALPEGFAVTLPAAVADEVPERQIIQLWD